MYTVTITVSEKNPIFPILCLTHMFENPYNKMLLIEIFLEIMVFYFAAKSIF